MEGEQYEELRQSIEDFDNIDQIALAQKLEKHELLELRRSAGASRARQLLSLPATRRCSARCCASRRRAPRCESCGV